VPPGLGLRARPEVPPEIMAVIAAAVDQAWPRAVAGPPPAGPPPYLAWRFSGRWWHRPLVARRARPYSSR
jgi:hypothetical protein